MTIAALPLSNATFGVSLVTARHLVAYAIIALAIAAAMGAMLLRRRRKPRGYERFDLTSGNEPD